MIADVAPRKSGTWRYPADVGREASPCEANVRRTEPPDAFTGLRVRICDATERSPLLHPSGMTVVTVRRGVRAEFSQAATICVKPPAEPRPAAWGRRYPQEREFSTAADFRSYVTDYCGTLTGRRPFICFVLAGDAPAFPEDGTEHLMRLACVDELNGKGCFGYAELMDLRGEKDRAERYRQLACQRGYGPGCPKTGAEDDRGATTPGAAAVEDRDDRDRSQDLRLRPDRRRGSRR